MKKIIISIMTLFAISTGVMSQNALTVDDIWLPQNGQATLTVNFQFDAADTYASYQFNLELPSDLEFVMEEGTNAKYVGGDCHDGHSITANLNEGLLKVTGLSGGKTLKGTSGILLQFTIKPKTSGLTIGHEYSCFIKDIVLATKDAAQIKPDDSNFKVTITQYTILDETSTIAPTAESGVDILVKRTIKANEWSTICLPFAMSEAQVKAAFGNDVLLGDFTGYTPTKDGSNVTAITVNFNDATAIEANHPYIIKVSSAITEFTADGVTIDPQEAIVSFGTTTTTGSGKNKVETYHPNDFIGTYIADFNFYIEAKSYPLFLNGNKFWYATENSMHMKAFRAYFDFDDYLPEAETSAPIFISYNNDITGIKNIQRTAEDGKYYNLNGQHVENLRKGQIYIKNNKKMVVK